MLIHNMVLQSAFLVSSIMTMLTLEHRFHPTFEFGMSDFADRVLVNFAAFFAGVYHRSSGGNYPVSAFSLFPHHGRRVEANTSTCCSKSRQVRHGCCCDAAASKTYEVPPAFDQGFGCEG